MLKNYFKLLLQKLLGFDNYLFIFSRFTIGRMRLGVHEKEFLHFLKMIPANGVVLDIGSNIGIMAVPLARKANDGKVFCFEPMPENIKALKRIISHFNLSNIEIFETALGEEAGSLTMVMPIVNHVKLQGYSHVVETKSDETTGEVFTVPVQLLDHIPALQNMSKIDAIKIDVENFEYHVLLGARDLLKRHKPVIYCELWNNEKRTLTMDLLKNDFGYRVMVLENNRVVEFTSQDVSNFFFT
jgi:FkbM family methyltransferase